MIYTLIEYLYIIGGVTFDSTILSITAPLRHQVIQSYLRQLCTLLEDTKYLPKLLLFLDLIPIPIVLHTETEIEKAQEKEKETDKDKDKDKEKETKL